MSDYNQKYNKDDVFIRSMIVCLLAEMNKKFTILIVSHDIGFVSTHVKRVICVRKNLQIHPVSELTGESLQHIYGLDINMIRHDHSCGEKGHSCLHS